MEPTRIMEPLVTNTAKELDMELDLKCASIKENVGEKINTKLSLQHSEERCEPKKRYNVFF